MRALASGVLGLAIAARAFSTTAGPVVHQYPVAAAGGAVQFSDGSVELLFPEPTANAIGKLSTDGSVTRLRLLPAGSRPLAIARESSSSSRVVFTEVGTNRIGVIDSGGLTEYDIPTPDSNPKGVAAPGLIWFTEYDGNRIGRLDPATATLTEFVVPTFAAGPLGIAPGPGAAPGATDLWFTEFLANKIGRIDANGAITEYPIPTPDSGPTALARVDLGGEVAMFFTESRADRIGKITASGVITEYPLPTPNDGVVDIVPDVDGVWFSERSAGRLGRLSFDGTIQEFALPSGTRPQGIAITRANPDGSSAPTSVWYLEGTTRIGRLSENRLYAVGAGHDASFDTEFELSGTAGHGVTVRLGAPRPACVPSSCLDPGVVLDVPAQGTVRTTASHVPNTDGVELYMVTGENLFEIIDLPATRAWIVNGSTGARSDLPIVDYWSVADAQPPVASGGRQPSLTFPARRRAGARTGLVLAALETGASGNLLLRIDAILPGAGVIASISRQLGEGQSLVLNNVLTDLGILQPFEGEIRVTRQSLAGLFWGVVELREGGGLLLLPPGSSLEQDCTLGPARCDPPRRTRVVTREANP